MRRIAAFALLGLLCLLHSNKVEARVYLVAVGISDYPGVANDLRHPVDDVRLVVNTYTAVQGTTYVQLCDNKATIGNIISSIREAFARASADDIVVLFISGHGYEGGFVAYDGLLGWNRIREAMAKCRSRHKMIFADACFAGTFGSPGRSPRKTRQGSHSEVMLFLSSRGDETSAESGSLKQGVFSAFLCNGLAGKADANHDRTVTAWELYSYVHTGVVRKTAGMQHPVMWGNFNKDMPVIRIE